MAFAINHIHLKSQDPGETADWWVKAFDFKILSDAVRDGGPRFLRCESTNGVIVNISGFPEGAPFGSGDASLHEGLEHFGLDSENLEADIERLEAMGAKLLDGPIDGDGDIRICFMQAPDDVRIELIQRSA